jgi:hypothetical protein
MTDNKSNSILICNIDRTDEINQRFLARNIPSCNSDILLGLRPQPTKYTFPIDVNNKQCNSIINTAYDTTNCFIPGDSKGPWSGYVTKVNDESVLRNQIYALQNNPQSGYIPNSNSDLYNHSVPQNGHNNAELLFPNLFNNYNNFNNENKKVNLGNVGNNLFNNYTRQQLKDN